MSQYIKVNGHIHTPYSFSAFNSIEQAVELAAKEDVQVLGINDFYTAEGYEEFNKACAASHIAPLFNIEFIGLIKEFQSKNIRINDPNNPGRIYFSGKGLGFPFHLKDDLQQKVSKLQKESNEQVKQMIEKVNQFFAQNAVQIVMDFDIIKNKYAKKLVRERHIAKAIRIELGEQSKTTDDKKELIKKIYGGKESKVDVNDNNALENEIRGMLLKSGGPAFVPEDENAFLTIQEIIEIIVNAGGIPCYPVLLDDAKGNFTDFEKEWNTMHEELSKMNVKCIELIPGRNSLEILEKFVQFFDNKKYVILFGTEHNAPELIPLTISCRNNVPLTEELNRVSYEGACVVMAHQHQIESGNAGFQVDENFAQLNKLAEFIELGDKLIKEIIKK